ncbi:MAG: hypothetical protein ABJZ55_16230, partial [Fuerstiella sp.]
SPEGATELAAGKRSVPRKSLESLAHGFNSGSTVVAEGLPLLLWYSFLKNLLNECPKCVGSWVIERCPRFLGETETYWEIRYDK